MKTAATLLLLVFGAAFAQAVPATASREIGQLFSALENSRCEFNRNGSWYDGHKAAEHLHMKYDYLARKGQVASAESFITLAATKSSMSGRPYLVRCGTAQPVESKDWFLGKLRELRGRHGD